MTKDLKIPKVTLLYDRILTTANKTVISPGKLILDVSKQGLTNRQTVLVVGPNVPDTIQVGQEIEINPGSFPVERAAAKNGIGPDTVTKVIVPIEVINNVEYIFISTREVKYIHNLEEKK